MQQFMDKTGKLRSLATGDSHETQSGHIVVDNEVVIGVKVPKEFYDVLLKASRRTGQAVEAYAADILAAKAPIEEEPAAPVKQPEQKEPEKPTETPKQEKPAEPKKEKAPAKAEKDKE
jgi:outer membrane biosynthesis protein TonB